MNKFTSFLKENAEVLIMLGLWAVTTLLLIPAIYGYGHNTGRVEAYKKGYDQGYKTAL